MHQLNIRLETVKKIISELKVIWKEFISKTPQRETEMKNTKEVKRYREQNEKIKQMFGISEGESGETEGETILKKIMAVISCLQ